jgi:hypothetical protein
MAFEIRSRHLGEVIVLGTRIYEDERGYFMGEFSSKVPRTKYSVLENQELKKLGLNSF